MKKLYKNKDGYYIIEGIGNIIYLPNNYDDLLEFIKDYLVDYIGEMK
jgi:hypothetical protein